MLQVGDLVKVKIRFGCFADQLGMVLSEPLSPTGKINYAGLTPGRWVLVLDKTKIVGVSDRFLFFDDELEKIR